MFRCSYVTVFQFQNIPGAEWGNCEFFEESKLHHDDVQAVQCPDATIYTDLRAEGC